MKKLLASLMAFGLIGMGSPVSALANNEVTVQFRPEVSQQFIKTLSQTFKAQVVQVDKQTWRFTVPALKTQDQFSELFASLPAVAATDPAPAYQVADHINPQAVYVQPLPQMQPNQSTSNYLPNEFQVKFRPGTSLDDIHFINSHYGANEISRLTGSDVWRLRLPQGMSVFEAIEAYQQSNLVEFAQPSYRMDKPTPVAPTPAPSGAGPTMTQQTGIPNGTGVYTQIPLDGGGQMLISFRPQTPAAHVALFHQIYGTRQVRQESFYEYRIQLPQGMNPNRALRIFMLYPNVINVQRLYS